MHGSSLNPNLVVLTTFVPLANKIILQGEKCTACLFGYAQIRNPTLWQIGSNVGSLLLWNTLRRTWIMLRFTCGTHPSPTRLSLPGINSTRVRICLFLFVCFSGLNLYNMKSIFIHRVPGKPCRHTEDSSRYRRACADYKFFCY